MPAGRTETDAFNIDPVGVFFKCIYLFLCVHTSLLIDSCNQNFDSITGPVMN